MHINPSAHQTPRLLRLPEVESLVGLKKSAIYQGIKDGSFPAPIKLSRRAVCWNSQAVEAWVISKIEGSTQ